MRCGSGRGLGIVEGGSCQEPGAPRGWEGGGAVSCVLGLAWPQELPLGEKSMEGSTHHPRGLEGTIKSARVIRTRARTYAWKMQGHWHGAEGVPGLMSPGSADYPVSRL